MLAHTLVATATATPAAALISELFPICLIITSLRQTMSSLATAD